MPSFDVTVTVCGESHTTGLYTPSLYSASGENDGTGGGGVPMLNSLESAWLHTPLSFSVIKYNVKYWSSSPVTRIGPV